MWVEVNTNNTLEQEKFMMWTDEKKEKTFIQQLQTVGPRDIAVSKIHKDLQFFQLTD